MRLSPILTELATDAAAAAAGIDWRCAAANFRWEHAVSDARADDYTDYVGDVRDHADWKAGHTDYVKDMVQPPKDLPRTSACFSPINDVAHLHWQNHDNIQLLRLESLSGLFSHSLTAALAERFWVRFFRSQKDLRKSSLPAPDQAMFDSLMMQWNQQRTQARPMFATTLRAFGGNLEALIKQDWPHLLRNRLGLEHWPSTPGQPLPVALMCYTLDDVRQARILATDKGATASCARPTMLDAEFSRAFVPSAQPAGPHSCGHTLDLSCLDVPDDFTPELLNFPLDYLPRHLKALGFISQPHPLESDAQWLDARNRHVRGLRQQLNCPQFGEELT
jgi:hypothetical protein